MKRPVMKWLMVSIASVCSIAAFSQDSMQMHYRIYDTRNKQVIEVEKMVADLANADVLFFGEEHNDSIGHYLENKIFRALHQQYRDRLALSMEMFESDNQLALDEYLAGRMDESRFSKDVRLWSNYKDYRPMIEYAKQNGIPVIAADPPRRYVTLVSRRGMQSLDSLSKEAKKFLPPLPYDTLIGRYRDKFFEVMKGSPGAGSPNIYYSQCLWDAGMSYRINSFLRKNKGIKIFHCVGKFHCEEKLGTVAQLQMRNPKLKIAVISCFPDKNFSNADPGVVEKEGFSNLGDYIILTNPELKKTF